MTIKTTATLLYGYIIYVDKIYLGIAVSIQPNKCIQFGATGIWYLSVGSYPRLGAQD